MHPILEAEIERDLAADAQRLQLIDEMLENLNAIVLSISEMSSPNKINSLTELK